MRRLRDWSGSRGGKKGWSFCNVVSTPSVQAVGQTYLTGLDGVPHLEETEKGPLDSADALLLVCILGGEGL